MPPTPSSRPLRVGLAGVGRFGQLHAGVLADRHGLATRYGDALELIADHSLDAVVQATPDEQHCSQACAALAQLESSWTVPAQAPANVLTDHWQGCIDAELAVVADLNDAVEALRIAEAHITAGRLEEVVQLDSGEAWP